MEAPVAESTMPSILVPPRSMPIRTMPLWGWGRESLEQHEGVVGRSALGRIVEDAPDGRRTRRLQQADGQRVEVAVVVGRVVHPRRTVEAHVNRIGPAAGFGGGRHWGRVGGDARDPVGFEPVSYTH